MTIINGSDSKKIEAESGIAIADSKLTFAF